MAAIIQLAEHTDSQAYWDGGNFELNMSFDMLTQEQWLQLVDALWADEQVDGPLTQRYVPNQALPPYKKVEYPEPTSTYIQHGRMDVEGVVMGIDVLITRSLFECITLMTPVGMFKNLVSGSEGIPYPLQDNPIRQCIESAFSDIALRIYRVAPFSIASLGWNREIQILNELVLEDAYRKKFFDQGNSFITDKGLKRCGRNPEDYARVASGLRWLPPLSL